MTLWIDGAAAALGTGGPTASLGGGPLRAVSPIAGISAYDNRAKRTLDRVAHSRRCRLVIRRNLDRRALVSPAAYSNAMQNLRLRSTDRTVPQQLTSPFDYCSGKPKLCADGRPDCARHRPVRLTDRSLCLLDQTEG